MLKNNDPGLGSKFSKPVKRILNSDGSYNINRIGGIKLFRDYYNFLLSTSWWQFFLIAFVFYSVINLFFTLLYLLVGVEGIYGLPKDVSPFLSLFFFSCQTFTTLGYGGIHPISIGANIVSSIEAFVGVLSIALTTGLLFHRFSKPNSKIAFSDLILHSKVNNESAVLFKMVNQRNNVLLRTKVSCILILNSEGGEEERNNKSYYPLTLERDFVLFFPLTWTIVHKIDESSPFFNLTFETLKMRDAEVVVFLETFDESYGVEILQKHSYAGEQWAENLKFDINFNANSEGKIDLQIHQLNKTSPI